MKVYNIELSTKEVNNIIDAIRYADRFDDADSKLKQQSYELIDKLYKAINKD